MLDMLCSFPAPCGNEEILKKYIVRKYPADWYEDSIGNLILHKSGTKEKIMLYVSIDEDGFLVMEKQDKKIYFAQLGNKKVYPGLCVNFGGYKGVVCSTDKDTPDKNQYIELLKEYEINQCDNGVADLEYYEDEGVAYTKEAASRLALDAILDVIDIKSDYDLYIVLGVQSNKGYKGAQNAVNSIKPDKIFAFEPTSLEELSYKVTTSGFMVNPECKNFVNELSENTSITIIPEINKEGKSCAMYLKSAFTVVFGIPVGFPEDIRQTVKIEYKNEVEKLIKTILL